MSSTANSQPRRAASRTPATVVGPRRRPVPWCPATTGTRTRRRVGRASSSCAGSMLPLTPARSGQRRPGTSSAANASSRPPPPHRRRSGAPGTEAGSGLGDPDGGGCGSGTPAAAGDPKNEPARVPVHGTGSGIPPAIRRRPAAPRRVRRRWTRPDATARPRRPAGQPIPPEPFCAAAARGCRCQPGRRPQRPRTVRRRQCPELSAVGLLLAATMRSTSLRSTSAPVTSRVSEESPGIHGPGSRGDKSPGPVC